MLHQTALVWDRQRRRVLSIRPSMPRDGGFARVPEVGRFSSIGQKDA